MDKKIIIKIVITVVFFIIFLYTFNNICVADFIASDWDPTNSTTPADNTLLSLGNKIIGPIQVIGSLVSVITIIIIGIKYMLGSIEERAQYKEILGPYLLGAAFVFGIVNIASIIFNIADSINQIWK